MQNLDHIVSLLLADKSSFSLGVEMLKGLYHNDEKALRYVIRQVRIRLCAETEYRFYETSERGNDYCFSKYYNIETVITFNNLRIFEFIADFSSIHNTHSRTYHDVVGNVVINIKSLNNPAQVIITYPISKFEHISKDNAKQILLTIDQDIETILRSAIQE
jgi:hydroxylamine reductase (hybrid-cluster protein)